MTALAGEPWRGLAKIETTTTVTGDVGRYLLCFDAISSLATGDQATWEGQPGDMFTLRLRYITGAAPALRPDAFEVHVKIPGGADVGSIWSGSFAPDGIYRELTRTYHLDDDPLSQVLNAIRSGTLELYLLIRRNTAVAWGPIDSRGVGTPAVGETFDWARGYVRSDYVLSSFLISNASLGGSEPASFASPDTTFNRVNLSAISYRAGIVTLKHRQSSADVRTEGSASGTGTQRDYTWDQIAIGASGKGHVNKDYAASLSNVAVRVVLPTQDFGGDNEYAWAGSGQASGFAIVGGDVKVLEHATRFTADPRWTRTGLLQINDSVFGAPPLSKDEVSGQRNSADLGFVDSRFRNARAEGAGDSVLAWIEKLWDAGELTGTEASPTLSRSATSATKGGETGWGDAFLTWDSVLPAGNWHHKAAITTSDMTGLELTPDRTVVLLASDPRVLLKAAGGDPTTPKDHFSPGKTLVIVIAAFTRNGSQAVALVLDADTIVFSLTRLNPSTTSKEYLDPTDLTGGPKGTWKASTGTSAQNLFSASVSAGDSTLYAYTFSATDTSEANGWNHGDIEIDCYANINGVTYHGRGFVTCLGKGNPHGRSFNGAAFATGLPLE